jgi:glutaredoxin
MEIQEPVSKSTLFYVYSKSGCLNCSKVKKILSENKHDFLEILCDEYLIEQNDIFLSFMKLLTKKEFIMFPIVFYETEFVGGHLETIDYLSKMINFEENF